MGPMEIFLICVGLGLLIAIGITIRFVCNSRCRGRCAKSSHTNDCILPTNSRLPSITPSLVQSGSRLTHISPSLLGGNSRMQGSYMPVISQPHALIRAEPSCPGEAAVFLTFSFPDDNQSSGTMREALGSIHAYVPASLSGTGTTSPEDPQPKHLGDFYDPPPKYEDLFPASHREALKTIQEEENPD